MIDAPVQVVRRDDHPDRYGRTVQRKHAMCIENVMTLLNHPAPAFWCSNNTDRTDKSEYLVPVRHMGYDPLPPERHQELRDRLGPIAGADQITAFYTKHDGASLFANPSTDEGAIILLPFEEWAERQEEALDWIKIDMDYHEDGESPKLPFTVEKLIAIGALNWSPDTWFLATDGGAAGKVYYWRHDGEPLAAEPYADDLSEFVVRLFKDVPNCFGGIVRFTHNDAVAERPPAGTELYPLRYITDWNRESELGRK
jgi:hypothetical protein